MARVMMTGGAGFIGSQVADAYCERGDDVLVLDNLQTGLRGNVPALAEFVEMDITSADLCSVVRDWKPDIINHHAAQIDVRASVADPAGDAQANILGSLNVCEAGRVAGVQQIIFASSGGAIYGEQEAFPATESHPEQPVNPYGVAKLAVEKYLHFYRREYGIACVALRYANVYGPRQRPDGEGGVIAIFCGHAVAGTEATIYGDGTQTRDFVYVGDVVAANIAASDGNFHGIVNVGTGEETSLLDLCDALDAVEAQGFSYALADAKAGEQARSSLSPGALQPSQCTSLVDGLRETLLWARNVQDTHSQVISA